MTDPAKSFDMAVAELAKLMGSRLSTAPAVLAHHGKDESYHPPQEPDAVVFPNSTDEVSEIVRVCARNHVPIIPFGMGTSLEGHVMAIDGGVSIDLGGLDKILRVNSEDLDVTVQAGVTRKQLNEFLRDTGLFFPVDPGANASIGGMTATRASGTNAVRYGTMRENVMGMTVVLPDARIICTSQRARKSSAGYDLTRLFVGSEGTLGVITEITLRLHGIPEAMPSAVCSFPTIKGAIDTVILTIQSGIPIARMEFLDALMMEATNRFSGLDLPIRPTLFFEFHGSQAEVNDHAEATQQIAAEFGGADFRWSHLTEERNRLWQARHDAAYAVMALSPGRKMWPTDVCVPISRLADCLIETKRDIDESFLTSAIVGHVGDGNFHCVILLNPDDKTEVAEAERLNERLVMRALGMEGTCTGEHGIGIGKRDFLVAEHGEAVNVMRSIKSIIDPHNIMNPGKVFHI